MCECTSKHICSVPVRHMSLIECQLRVFVCQSQPLPLRCELSHTSGSLRDLGLFSLLFHLAVSVALAAGAGGSASGSTAPPPLPVPLSLQYGSPVWEAAVPIGHCCAALPWALAPLCRPTLWKRPAPAGLCRSGRCSSSLPGPSPQRSAADRRHLVCACAAGPPASAALTPNSRPSLKPLCCCCCCCFWSV